MANYTSLKATIDANIRQNGNEEITGPILNTVLKAAVDSLGAGYLCLGVATPSTNPGAPDQNVCYIAGPGTYTHFGGLVVEDNEVALLVWSGSWTKNVTGAATTKEFYETRRSPLVIVEQLTRKYLNTSGNLADGSADFRVIIYSVKAGDVVTITVNGGAGSSILYGLYSGETSADISSVNLLALGKRMSQSNGDNVIEVEEDCLLAVTFYRSVITGMERVSSYSLSERVATLEGRHLSRYSLLDGILRVAFPYGSDDMLITLGPTGGNGLFDFIEFRTMPRGTTIAPGVGTLVLTTGTDWVAPFIVSAKNNADGDNIGTDGNFHNYFTGGNHQYNNTGSGSSRTATLEDLSFIVDGIERTSGEGLFHKITVKWTDVVQAKNTTKVDGSGRAVLREIHTLEIIDNLFRLQTQIVALEDIIIEKWYAMQYSGAATVYNKALYPGGANRGEYTGESDCGNSTPNGIIAYGDTHRLELISDNTFDLGSRLFYSGTQGAFRTSTKGYLFILQNADFSAGDNGFVRGSWRFSPA